MKPLFNFLIAILFIFVIVVQANADDSSSSKSDSLEEIGQSELLLDSKEFATKTTLIDGLLFPLRIPKYLMIGLTWPVKKLIEANEEYALAERALDLFSFRDETIWIYPTLGYSTRDGFSYGAIFRYEDFLDDDDRELELSVNHNINREFSTGLAFSDDGYFEDLGVSKISVTYSEDNNRRFFGFGSLDDDARNDTLFREQKTEASLKLSWNIIGYEFFQLQFLGGYLNSITDSGESQSTTLNAETEFPDILQLGFGQELEFAKYGLGFKVSRLAPRGLPNRGEEIEVNWVRYDQTGSSNEFSFDRVDVRAVKVVDLYKRTHMLAFGTEYTSTEAVDDKVPFNELASLGKETFLRGFDSRRFRNFHSLSGTIEYRYPIWWTHEPERMFGHSRIFVDFGKSFSDWKDFSDEDLETSYGVGMMVASRRKFFAEFELALSREALQFSVSLNREI